MKSKTFIPLMAFAAAIATNCFGQNPYETIEGSVRLTGLGTINNIAFSDVKVSAKLGMQESGPKVSGPTLTNPVVAVDGVAAKLAKLTNKEILQASGLDPKGKKIRWARTSQGAVLEAYDKNGPIKQIPSSVLSADVSWARNYAGIYGGGADLTATSSPASGTSVFVSSGKLTGLTALTGTALGYIPYSGVGKFTSDSKKQLSTTVRIAGLGEAR